VTAPRSPTRLAFAAAARIAAIPLAACAEPPDDDGARTSARLEVGPPVVCPAPEARDTLGPLAPPLTGGDWGRQPYDPDNADLFTGGGLLVADLDGDGLHDLLLPRPDASRLYRQGPVGTFTDVSPFTLPPDPDGERVGATAVDLDGDDALDVVLTGYRTAPVYWHNLGDGRFEDLTAAAGLTDPVPGRRTTTASAADWDLDGDLDLFIAGFGPFYADPRGDGDPSSFHINRGDGTFEHASHLVPTSAHIGYTFVGGWQHLNEDPYPDLYLVNDFGHFQPNQLLWNRAGVWEPDDGAAGLTVPVQGMGLGWGDLDGDGRTDVAVAGWGNNRLMLSGGGAGWFEGHQARGFDGDLDRGQQIGWASITADLDADGDLDLVEGFGAVAGQGPPLDQPDEIFLHQPDGQFEPVGERWGFAHPGQTRGVLAVDVDGDGWLDLARRDLTGPATVQLARCGAAAWTIIRLDDPDHANHRGIGARVRVLADGAWQEATVDAGSHGVMSGGPPELHFGLGGARRVERIEVRWPDGDTDTVGPAPARRVLEVHRR
jgi:hypothetical protein